MNDYRPGSYLESEITDGTDVMTVDGSASDARGTILQDFAIFGNGSEGNGISTHSHYQSGRVQNVGVYRVGGRGFEFIDGWTQTYSKLRAFGNQANYYIQNCNRAVFSDVHSHNAGGNGYVIESSNGPSFIGCSEEGDSQSGFWAKSTSNGVYFYGGEGNSHTDHIECDGFRIWGAKTRDVTNNGIWLDGCSHGVVANCYLDEATRHINISGSAHDITIRDNVYAGTSTAVNVGSGNPYDIDVYGIPSFNGETGVVPSSSTYTMSFDTAFSEFPVIDPSDAPGASQYRFIGKTTDANGNIDSVDVNLLTTGGNAVTPDSFHWKAWTR